MEKIYGGDGKNLNYDRDQLVNMMISAMEKYKTEGGSVDGGIINYYDSIRSFGLVLFRRVAHWKRGRFKE